MWASWKKKRKREKRKWKYSWNNRRYIFKESWRNPWTFSQWFEIVVSHFAKCMLARKKVQMWLMLSSRMEAEVISLKSLSSKFSIVHESACVHFLWLDSIVYMQQKQITNKTHKACNNNAQHLGIYLSSTVDDRKNRECYFFIVTDIFEKKAKPNSSIRKIIATNTIMIF